MSCIFFFLNVSLMETKCYAKKVNKGKMAAKVCTYLKKGGGLRWALTRGQHVRVQPHFPVALLPNTSAATERGYLTQVTWPGLSFP